MDLNAYKPHKWPKLVILLSLFASNICFFGPHSEAAVELDLSTTQSRCLSLLRLGNKQPLIATKFLPYGTSLSETLTFANTVLDRLGDDAANISDWSQKIHSISMYPNGNVRDFMDTRPMSSTGRAVLNRAFGQLKDAFSNLDEEILLPDTIAEVFIDFAHWKPSHLAVLGFFTPFLYNSQGRFSATSQRPRIALEDIKRSIDEMSNREITSLLFAPSAYWAHKDKVSTPIRVYLSHSKGLKGDSSEIIDKGIFKIINQFRGELFGKRLGKPKGYFLEELNPAEAIFRSVYGGDCTASCVGVYSLRKGFRAFRVSRSNNSGTHELNNAGYIIVGMALYEGRTIPYLFSANGPFLSKDILNGSLYILAHIFGSEEFLVPEFNPNETDDPHYLTDREEVREWARALGTPVRVQASQPFQQMEELMNQLKPNENNIYRSDVIENARLIQRTEALALVDSDTIYHDYNSVPVGFDGSSSTPEWAPNFAETLLLADTHFQTGMSLEELARITDSSNPRIRLIHLQEVVKLLDRSQPYTAEQAAKVVDLFNLRWFDLRVLHIERQAEIIATVGGLDESVVESADFKKYLEYFEKVKARLNQ